ncbi:hypothetical protein ACWGI8_39745 [Streptomyces sp. NPDC054841]
MGERPVAPTAPELVPDTSPSSGPGPGPGGRGGGCGGFAVMSPSGHHHAGSGPFSGIVRPGGRGV